MNGSLLRIYLGLYNLPDNLHSPIPCYFPAYGRPDHEIHDYNRYEEYRRYSPRANESNMALWGELWAHYKPRVVGNASQFDGASMDQLREHFRARAIERDMLDVFPGYCMLAVIDEESFQSLQHAPFPQNQSPKLEYKKWPLLQVSFQKYLRSNR